MYRAVDMPPDEKLQEAETKVNCLQKTCMWDANIFSDVV